MSPSILLILAAAALSQTAPQSPGLAEIARVQSSELREASALVASRRHPGVFWTVPDSGNPPHLYALDRSGKVLAVYRVSDAVNLDWECLALDSSGRLYICDVGNNEIDGRSRLRQRWVYVVREPDPHQPPPAGTPPDQPRPLPLERTILVRYPHGPFDIEAAFACGDAAYFVSKQRQEAAIYRLPLSPARGEGDQDEEAVTLEKVADLPALDRATAAALSDDGRRLAICTYTEVWIYNTTCEPEFRLLSDRPAVRRAYLARAVEACAWDDRRLLLLNEHGVLYHLPLDRP